MFKIFYFLSSAGKKNETALLSAHTSPLFFALHMELGVNQETSERAALTH